ncbi:hypothetical protein MSTHC_2262 [Methanosarcina thermophila CHTI-55]|uniref:Uncharacterized protein n=2 Tax=Methanosarcina thermophila TaxID=2210 RepID=A0A0E3NH55_METTE|nr:hypothetical protein MSTHT_1043 [Methanosarcina thermophila TM-1]AKB16580.1 hypothetical protein MSTHC_2262 [Methanosarcina thermophila CHTI-55]
MARSLSNHPFYCTFMERATCAFDYLPCNSLIPSFHHHSYSFFEIFTIIFFICRPALPPIITYPVVR